MFLGPMSHGKDAFHSLTWPMRYGEARTYCQYESHQSRSGCLCQAALTDLRRPSSPMSRGCGNSGRVFENDVASSR